MTPKEAFEKIIESRYETWELERKQNKGALLL